MEDDIRWVRTHCGRMDHGGCTLLVGVKDNKIVRVKGDPGATLVRVISARRALHRPID